MVRIAELGADVCDVNQENLASSKTGISVQRGLNLAGTKRASVESAYLKDMGKRILSWARWTVLVVVATVCFLWLYLYFDSVHQRRKAEHLVSELTALPTDADFAQVRNFSIRYGGRAVSTKLEFGSTECTSQGCLFEIEIKPAIAAVLDRGDRFRHVIVLAENSAGLRPWVVTVTFTVRNGILQHTSILLGQVRMQRLGEYDGPTAIIYSVGMGPTITASVVSDYVVVHPHVTGEPADGLSAHVVPTSSGRWKRAFDIHLDCFTTIFRGCADFRQLAPSAWADYEEAARRSR